MPPAINLIFTQHKANGLCNAQVLLQLIETIKPDIIFEELSHKNFQLAHVEKTLNNLESVAIRKYLETNNIKHIPVDTYDRPKNYEMDQHLLHKRLTGGTGYEFFQLRSRITDEHQSRISQHGFHLLNSDQNDMLHESLTKTKINAIEKLNDKKMNQTAELDKEVIVKREDVILDNVYQYARLNDFRNGLMFIGSGHRKSILKKIEERNRTEEIEIKWKYFQDLIA